jgi:hypothetical protein
MNRLHGHERGQVLALAAVSIAALMGSPAIVTSRGSRNYVGCAARAAVSAAFRRKS